MQSPNGVLLQMYGISRQSLAQLEHELHRLAPKAVIDLAKQDLILGTRQEIKTKIERVFGRVEQDAPGIHVEANKIMNRQVHKVLSEHVAGKTLEEMLGEAAVIESLMDEHNWKPDDFLKCRVTPKELAHRFLDLEQEQHEWLDPHVAHRWIHLEGPVRQEIFNAHASVKQHVPAALFLNLVVEKNIPAHEAALAVQQGVQLKYIPSAHNISVETGLPLSAVAPYVQFGVRRSAAIQAAENLKEAEPEVEKRIQWAKHREAELIKATEQMTPHEIVRLLNEEPKKRTEQNQPASAKLTENKPQPPRALERVKKHNQKQDGWLNAEEEKEIAQIMEAHGLELHHALFLHGVRQNHAEQTGKSLRLTRWIDALVQAKSGQTHPLVELARSLENTYGRRGYVNAIQKAIARRRK